MSTGPGHALVVQNKGGGHGEIGFHLARVLRSMGLEVTLLQDAKADKAALPFARYEMDLDCDVAWCDPTDPAQVNGALEGRPPLTHVFDNYAKAPEDVGAVAAAAQASPDFALYSYVSSAGMYNAVGELREGTPVKDPPTGQRQVELALGQAFPGKWCSFRPQYIYGPYTNKRDYLDWFLHRAVRDLPLPIPGDGSQVLSVTHCEDVATLMASVVGRETSAGGEVFNCGTTQLVTYDSLCFAVARALRKDVFIKNIPAGTKTSFPFRPNAEGFWVKPDKALQMLGWPGSRHGVIEDLDGFYTKDFFLMGLDKID
eukprot:CAMPEP_0206016240 /NCGR_PEP_ID=MMETSP1464-20131121/22295_1 /ASSEMBLY_ACC=CAM_ASM_001124 /TAXON_ID=119497 /ORGANISM="Exanthemachrysis gayraliae, Strain RCC1523" /LENGTH=313 /DNA_ID=CAMNT_0053390047 /DNA_START=1 /DNA_END=939 /DNA_ORIENTATION=+